MSKQPKFEKKVLERHVKAAVKKRLDEIGAYHWWPVTRGMGQSGLDCIGCYRGRFFAVETKAPGKKPTARQQITIAHIEGADGLVYVIDSIEAANRILFR